jgi:DNA polymerase III epsilon subunit-like protein
MKNRKVSLLDLAVRVYPVLTKGEPHVRETETLRRPDMMLLIDTETRTDETQRLTFGSFRLFKKGRCIKERLFHADDLPDCDCAVLERYVRTHRAETAEGGSLELLTRSEFVREFFEDVYRSRCLLVGFNLPFDLSRIARAFGRARRWFAGGFSLELWTYRDSNGVERSDKYRPRICIKHFDSKKASIGFTSRKQPDEDDRIPEDSEDGEPERDFTFRGYFLDLRTLASALTDQSYTLETACKAFGVEHGKEKVKIHGAVTEEYIDYNRRDVLATAELAVKLLSEFDKHPIMLKATSVYSPASIGKAYLRGLGNKSILERQPDFPKEFLGYAASAFFGGRPSAHVRKIPVPVVLVDFLSMYPTVNSLMDLWRFVIAQEIHVVENCREEILDFLKPLKPKDLFNRNTWKFLTAFVKVIPDGDILPTRAKYGRSSNDWQVAVNHLYAGKDQGSQALWFSLPDVVASVILTGKIPNIVEAFRIEARGTLPGLKKIKLYGQVEIDPGRHDFFKRVIEERQRLSVRTDLPPDEKTRLDKALKVIANSASYGIYAEMNRQESDEKKSVTCHGIDRKPFDCRVTHPDVPGKYCFPPLASLITGAARLMLALLEYSVSEMGGTYAMEDTDSMAIVATKRGGVVECPGGAFRTKDERPAIQALRWEQVAEISQRFAALNPYDREAVSGSILKIEDDNFDPQTGAQRQLHCFAISAKRYTLFMLNKSGEPVMLREHANNKTDRWSQHGLGHVLNPTDPESNDRDWIGQVWLNIVRRRFGFATTKLSFENLPAVGRISVSSPAVMRVFESFNEGKCYVDRIKPFNFTLSCQVKALGHPTEPTRSVFT